MRDAEQVRYHRHAASTEAGPADRHRQRGRRHRAPGRGGRPEVPGSYALGVVDDPDLTARCADTLAGHLATLGITASYAPVADIQRQADNPIVRTRAFGTGPELVSRHLSAWIAATEARGIASCAKHFPGHGGTLTDSHHELAVDPRPYDELDLGPFRTAIAAGVPMLMSAHVVFPALDPNR